MHRRVNASGAGRVSLKNRHEDTWRGRIMGRKVRKKRGLGGNKRGGWMSEEGHAGWSENATTWRDQPAAFCWLFSSDRWSCKSFLCCRKIITAGRLLCESSNKHTMTQKEDFRKRRTVLDRAVCGKQLLAGTGPAPAAERRYKSR